MIKQYTLERIQQCLDACEGIRDPVATLGKVREYIDDLHTITTNEGYITVDVERVINTLGSVRKELGK